jgi:hypothetical protein
LSASIRTASFEADSVAMGGSIAVGCVDGSATAWRVTRRGMHEPLRINAVTAGHSGAGRRPESGIGLRILRARPVPDSARGKRGQPGMTTFHGLVLRVSRNA